METSSNQIKKKRSLPGMPDPNSEVIALSPNSLLATNRFVCEVCNKGFQRDQNLQLHKRGHNLPWKLRQRSGDSKEVVKRKVYVCPEASCIHHNPERALGDLTGIKKHYCRKHGEKKWKCERCCKQYAVQSDWKAHVKICGSKEYKCDCGTVFSRRDSFLTHRAFCDALAEESVRARNVTATITTATTSAETDNLTKETTVAASSPPPPLTPSATTISPVLSMHSPELTENSTGVLQQTSAAAFASTVSTTSTSAPPIINSCSYKLGGNKTTVFASIFAPSTATPPSASSSHLIPSVSPPSMQQHIHLPSSSTTTTKPTSLCVSSSASPSLYLSNSAFSLFPTLLDHHQEQFYAARPSQQPTMSATALLQKAAEMGAKASNSSFLCGFSLSSSSSSGTEDRTTSTTTTHQWSSHVKKEIDPLAPGLSLGVESTGLTNMMMGPTLFANEPPTLDLLGLGIGSGNSSTGRLSAFLNSMGGGIDVASFRSGSEYNDHK